MKKISALLSASYFILIACNNTADDSVEKADSINAANTDTSATGNRNAVVTDEKSSAFLVRAANSGMAEVQLAKIAQQKATLDAVKSFAAMLEKDHSSVNEQVKNLAAQRNVTLPATISDDKQKMISDCEKKTGKDFDKEYLSVMVKSHNDGIDLFEDVRANATDIDVKNFADKTLPALRMHLDSAKAVQKRYW
jgi:putative membrane protein